MLLLLLHSGNHMYWSNGLHYLVLLASQTPLKYPHVLLENPTQPPPQLDEVFLTPLLPVLIVFLLHHLHMNCFDAVIWQWL